MDTVFPGRQPYSYSICLRILDRLAIHAGFRIRTRPPYEKAPTGPKDLARSRQALPLDALTPSTELDRQLKRYRKTVSSERPASLFLGAMGVGPKPPEPDTALSPKEVQRYPESVSDGQSSVGAGALGELIARVYPTLQRMAAAKVRGSGLSPSSVVQDTLIRVLKLPSPPQSEPQLEAAAWKLMEWVILDRVRSEQARDHRERASMDARSEPWQSPQLEHLSRAMSELAKLDPRRAEVVTLCLACGLPMTRVAELLDISVRTVQRDLEFSKAWLAVCIERQETPRPSDAQSIPATG